MRRRGSTLIEMSLALVLTALLIGVLASLYAFTTRRTADAMANYATASQSQILLDSISGVVSQAVSCTTVTSSGNTGLKCTMPQQGKDFDSDGYANTYTPIRVGRTGTEKWGTGMRIWFYNSDSSGDFTKLGTVEWRAQRSDDNVPTSADADAKWAFYYGTGKARFDLVSGLSFVVSSSAQSVQTTVQSQSLARDLRQAVGTDGPVYTVSLVGTSYWRNWRK